MKKLFLGIMLVSYFSIAGQFSDSFGALVEQNKRAAKFSPNEQMKKMLFSGLYSSMTNWIKVMKERDPNFVFDETDENLLEEVRDLAGK